ncbi:ribokinase [Faunimonas pinastri]|uniref:Ribokinase n=1 Tax=Faunimonas pinastri TaxID=1855383 RepID=A0A1H9C408_9HYPH|nr:carbohydrate kinase family protein [Faunimonas pinastri]SEP95956.1 ribokinase [Faunimonas pinastri]
MSDPGPLFIDPLFIGSLFIGPLFIGDVSWDLTFAVSHVPAPDEKVHAGALFASAGGVVVNAAVAASCAGARPTTLLRLGDDATGRLVEADLGAKGVRVRSTSVAGATCHVVIMIEPHGEKRMVLYPGVSMYPADELIVATDFSAAPWVHTSVYDRQAASLVVGKCREHGVRWSLDLEPATFPDGIETLSDHLDGAELVFCNARSAAQLGGDPVEILQGLGVRNVVLTLGPDGAAWHGRQGTFSVAAPHGKVVDTTGAGDCLAGWLIAELLADTAPEIALRNAVAAATLSCGIAGAQASYPTRAQVEETVARSA